MKKLPAVDAVIVGGGWAGLLMAKELGARTSLNIVVLERGASRGPSEYATDMDELDYAIRLRMMQDLSKETVTLRHDLTRRALPLRQHGAFLPGAGVGGSGEHWNAQVPRFLPDCFELLTKTTEKYGANALPEDHAVRNWGITYNELESYYTRVDKLLGTSGKAGNLRGKLIEGGNIFDGWHSEEYPTPPTKMPYFSALFRDAARSLGYHPYPAPSANISQSYTNPDGVSRGGCTYCGFCAKFGCMVGAKAQPTNLLLPVIQKRKNVSLRTGAWVRRVLFDSAPKPSARGVTYIDAAGEEIFQPSSLVFLASWTFNNTRLLLLSGIGEPYDPATGRGTVGSNLTHQVSFGAATAFFDQPLNRFMGSGSAGILFSDFDRDDLDRGSLNFIRGGYFSARGYGFQPIGAFGVLPNAIKATWGWEWKKASVSYYDRTATIGFTGEHLAYKTNFMGLDPVYKDALGDPLLRLTLDWRDNERKMAEFATPKAVEVARAMGVREINPFPGLRSYDATHYNSTHIQGGTIMGDSPANSVVSPTLQHWQLPNLFILGGSTFPQNATANPTPTVLAFVYRAADAIIDRYLKHAGPLG
ncbi:MAG TPA: GMC family oxidoreductase [Candidatus Acidoferrum sp.]|nr:GMC family oxidoreductase [Candidatus Acidoferrum sp.]